MPKSGPIKRHGGKSYLARRLIDLMPPHTRYCEPFFGGGAVLLQKEYVGVAEYVNDLDQQLVHFWNVLADSSLFASFKRRIECIPFSEPHFDQARERLGSSNGHRTPLEVALDFFVL